MVPHARLDFFTIPAANLESVEDGSSVHAADYVEGRTHDPKRIGTVVVGCAFIGNPRPFIIASFESMKGALVEADLQGSSGIGSGIFFVEEVSVKQDSTLTPNLWKVVIRLRQKRIYARFPA